MTKPSALDYIAALTPSADTKAAYIGEFQFQFPERDEEGNDVMRNINVPWTTIKEIMRAIDLYAERLASERG